MGRVPPWDIRQMSTHLSHTHTYTVPVEVVQNDRINFQTVVNCPEATNTIVSLLIELDM